MPQITQRFGTYCVAAVVAAAMLVLSANALAEDSPGSLIGYYVQNPISKTIPGGPTTSFGTPVAVLTKTVVHGSYLITARIDGQSTAPNSGATCYFVTSNGHQVGTQYYTVNTSSDYIKQVNVSVVALNRFTTSTDTTVTLACAHGYLFANSSIFGGEMILTPVDTLGP